MAELIFEPFAARFRWNFAEPRDAQVWGSVLASYLDALARRCDDSGPCVIGHIKGFAPMPGGYLRVNVTSPTAGADVEVHCAEQCAELTLTINVLVYGLPAEVLASLATKAADEVAVTHDATATLVERE